MNSSRTVLLVWSFQLNHEPDLWLSWSVDDCGRLQIYFYLNACLISSCVIYCMWAVNCVKWIVFKFMFPYHSEWGNSFKNYLGAWNTIYLHDVTIKEPSLGHSRRGYSCEQTIFQRFFSFKRNWENGSNKLCQFKTVAFSDHHQVHFSTTK
jgi:hypothetical protein